LGVNSAVIFIRIDVRFPAGARDVSHSVRTGSEAHPHSYPVCTSGRSVKLAAQFDLVPRPSYVFIAWCLWTDTALPCVAYTDWNTVLENLIVS
jgi:hypothetical protein